MNPLFQNPTWSLELPPPWQVKGGERGSEITQPEGTGVMLVSSLRKKEGAVTETETLAHLQKACPPGSRCEKVQCGEFAGYVADYVDWTTSRFWRVWFVACGQDLLHITYTCWRGEEELEAGEASLLLRGLRARA